VIANADDPKLMEISESFPGRRVLYGVNAPADYRASEVRDRALLGSSFTLEAEGDRRPISFSIPGRHNLENLLAAIATARTAGISWEGIERGIGRIQPAYHRGVLVEWRGATLYDDTYNSNPYALSRALELLARAEARGRKIAVIGDMLELGPDELKFHRDSGRSMPRSVDVIVGIGMRSESLLAGARDAGFDPSALHHFPDAASATPFVRDLIREGDFVLLKGSRGIGLDRIIEALIGDDVASESSKFKVQGSTRT
ncbi:MAG TPA: cyanophycin synthetase, partial [Thermoanaerobaculia bacterium]